MTQFHFDPETYMALMHQAIPVFDEFQEAVGVACCAPAPGCLNVSPSAARVRVLDLGAGTGETATAVLQRFPGARITLLDTSAQMLRIALRRLPPENVESTVLGDIAHALPPGLFHLVVSGLAVHHLGSPEKQDLFERVRTAIEPGGRFVMGDVVVPEDPGDAVTPLWPAHDFPASAAQLHAWLAAAGLKPEITWVWRDLAVIAADRPR